MSQFAFLKTEFADIFGHAARAETLAYADPRGAAFYCRLALETAVGWLYRHDRTLKDPYDPTLAALLAEPSFQALVGRTLAVKARFIKDTGNAAAHGKPISAAQAGTALREFFHVAYWLARSYGRGAKPPADASFRIEALPRVTQVATTTLAQLQEAARRFKETVEARNAAEAARRASEEGRIALEAEIKALQSSRPSSMPTAWRRNTGSGRSSSTAMVTSTGCGTTPGIRRAPSRASSRRTSWR